MNASKELWIRTEAQPTDFNRPRMEAITADKLAESETGSHVEALTRQPP